MELAVDANIASVLVANNGLTQLNAGYCACPSSPNRLITRSYLVAADGAVFGFLNIVTRPAGGWFADLAYRRYGIGAKKHLTLAMGFLMGGMSLALGLYSRAQWDAGQRPELGVTMGIISLLAIFCEVGNGCCLCVLLVTFSRRTPKLTPQTVRSSRTVTPFRTGSLRAWWAPSATSEESCVAVHFAPERLDLTRTLRPSLARRFSRSCSASTSRTGTTWRGSLPARSPWASTPCAWLFPPRSSDIRPLSLDVSLALDLLPSPPSCSPSVCPYL